VVTAPVSYQLAFVLPPAAMLSFWVFALTRGTSRRVRAGLLAAWAVGVVATFAGFGRSSATYTWDTLVGAPDSAFLWTTTLQSADERLVRRQPIRSGLDNAPLQLRARYVWDAAAAPAGVPRAQVLARLNGTDLGARTPGLDPEEAWCCWVLWDLPPGSVRAGTVAEIEVWLSRRDPRVRFIAQRNPYAAQFGPAGSLFFDGQRLHPGVPHSHSGTIRPAFLHVWIEAAP
jgi:hypothetical protein